MNGSTRVRVTIAASLLLSAAHAENLAPNGDFAISTAPWVLIGGPSSSQSMTWSTESVYDDATGSALVAAAPTNVQGKKWQGGPSFCLASSLEPGTYQLEVVARALQNIDLLTLSSGWYSLPDCAPQGGGIVLNKAAGGGWQHLVLRATVPEGHASVRISLLAICQGNAAECSAQFDAASFGPALLADGFD